MLQRAIWTTAKTMTLQVHALNVQPDHVHFAFSAPPKYSISEVARQLKGSSSHFLGEHHEGFWPGWQTEYGVVSFGGQSLPRIVQYVNHQDDHHREARLWLELEKGTELIVPQAIDIALNESRRDLRYLAPRLQPGADSVARACWRSDRTLPNLVRSQEIQDLPDRSRACHRLMRDATHGEDIPERLVPKLAIEVDRVRLGAEQGHRIPGGIGLPDQILDDCRPDPALAVLACGRDPREIGEPLRNRG